MKFEAEQRKEEREFQLRMAEMYSTSHREAMVVVIVLISPTFFKSDFYYGLDNS